MDWFKHQTNSATHDDRIATIFERLGVAGYGRYVMLLEILIGSAVDWDTTPTTTLTIKQWAEKLRSKPKQVEVFLGVLNEVQLVICSVATEQAVGSCSAASEKVARSKPADAQQRISVKLCNYAKLLPKEKPTKKGVPTEREKEEKEQTAKQKSSSLGKDQGEKNTSSSIGSAMNSNDTGKADSYLGSSDKTSKAAPHVSNVAALAAPPAPLVYHENAEFLKIVANA
jgi:hypothetical protein